MKHSERIEVVTDMLLRIPILRAQLVMYNLVSEADDHSFRRSLAEEVLGFSRKQFQSALNALSKRINETPGPLARLRPGWQLVFTSTKTNDDEVFVGQPDLLAAIRSIPKLSEFLAENPDTVRDRGEFRLEPGDAFRADDLDIDQDLDELRADPVIGETERTQLSKARVGQGLFRERVARIERGCRVTGVRDLRHLRASHIKPWKLSTHHERLDGANGLLLAPHVDHLFDRGFISFADDGCLLASTHLEPQICRAWGIDTDARGARFTDAQKSYLAHHRSNTFLAVPASPSASRDRRAASRGV